jgi:hypothetical protein
MPASGGIISRPCGYGYSNIAGNCGRGPDVACGMIDPEECTVHASSAADDPALLSYAGTRRQAREQLKAARRQGLRF